MFPLLRNADSYIPDEVDLTQDYEARTHWLNCFKETLEKVRELIDSNVADLCYGVFNIADLCYSVFNIVDLCYSVFNIAALCYI